MIAAVHVAEVLDALEVWVRAKREYDAAPTVPVKNWHDKLLIAVDAKNRLLEIGNRVVQ